MIRRTAIGLWLFICVPISEAVLSQELSTDVYPSEDELREALRLSEIDYEQYIRLLEIALFGVDSTSRFLYDQVPNLSYFLLDGRGLETPLEAEQQRLVNDTRRPSGAHGELRYRYLKQLDEEAASGYRLNGRLRLGERLTTTFRINRELSGRERVAGRTITYKSRRGLIRELTVGNFTQRFGLGTMIGYRGKVLDYSDELNEESILFPDYGGFNGLLVKSRARGLQATGIGSYNRDDEHRISTLAGMIHLNRGGFRPGVLFAANRLERRADDSALVDAKIGLHSEFHYGGGYGSVEISGQFADFGNAVAGIFEGRHRFALAEIRYAGWGYGDRFFDLTSGGKAGNLQRRLVVNELSYEYSSKRTGQEGGLIRTTVLLTDRLSLTGSVLHAQYRRELSSTQFSTELVAQRSEKFTLQLDYMNRRRRGSFDQNDDLITQHRLRMEARLRGSDWRMRTYVAYNSDQSRPDYLSLFVDFHIETADFGSMEVWSNLGRLEQSGLAYWYMFVRNEFQIADNMLMASKLGNAYRRDAVEEFLPTASIEMRVFL